VFVQPGDQIVADADGVVVVPQAAWAAAGEGGRAVQRRETEVAADLTAGKRLADILSLSLG
jgi:regulator of RNase E activity RraA